MFADAAGKNRKSKVGAVVKAATLLLSWKGEVRLREVRLLLTQILVTVFRFPRVLINAFVRDVAKCSLRIAPGWRRRRALIGYLVLEEFE